MRVEKWKGRLQVESNAAKVNAHSVEGEVAVNNFSGESALTAIKGHSTLKAKTGTSTVTKLEGGFEFLNGRGGLSAQQIQGVVRGSTDDGAVSVSLGSDVSKEAQNESDVVIESIDGMTKPAFPAPVMSPTVIKSSATREKRWIADRW